MLKLQKEDRLYFQSEVLNKNSNIVHCFTTSCGGLSHGKVRGLNLGYRVGDDEEAVNGNYRLVAQDFDLSFERITAGRQTHSANIAVIREDDAGKGISRESDFEDIDGLVTNIRDLPLVVYYADCVPILMCDERAGVVAAVHSGWRGTVAEISANAVGIMVNEFGARAENIFAAIGPSIGPCCFETGREVAAVFDDCYVKELKNGKFIVDLWSANQKILKNRGLKEENIDVLGMCTICNSDTLYSYRTHKETTGRMGAFISLNKGGF